MNTDEMTFGRFIREKRLADPRVLTLKEIASRIDLSLSMLSDIEQGRRKPFDSEKIELFCEYLNLTATDKARMYDLAAKEKSEVPSDIEETMMNTEMGDMARMALRMTKAGIANEEDWKSFIRQLEKKTGDHDD